MWICLPEPLNSLHKGWEPKFYVDGHSASVAVGQSTNTQNLWLSINGKVDASTGADMPTQILSGELPLKIHPKKDTVNTLVVGLASGVTAMKLTSTEAIRSP